MKKMYFYFFIVLGIVCYSCISSKNALNIEMIAESYNYVDITDSFQMKVIMYMPCGPIRTAPCATFFVGINDKNDTIRVLSVHDILYTYQYNDEVWVIPEPIPNYSVTTSICINSINRRKIELCEWQTNKYYKTIYGKIIKQ